MIPVEPEIESGYVIRRVTRWRDGVADDVEDAIADEVPVAMVYNGVNFAVMMTTPHDLEDFALGFSLSEKLIDSPAALEDIDIHRLLEGIELSLRVSADSAGARIQAERQRVLPGRSGCGICGTRELEQAVRQHPPVGHGITVSRPAVERAFAQLQRSQPINAATGAVHAAAWADAQGQLHAVREDVGRHNALDKLIGALHRAGIDPSQGMVLVTSRASYEMATKAISAGVTLLAAISAPTALAIELARSAGLTMLGFTRPGGHNIYTHPYRITDDATV